VYDPTTCGNIPNHTLVDTVTYEEMKEPCPECVYDPTTCGNIPNHTLVDNITYEEMKEPCPECPECVYDTTTCGNIPNHTLVPTSEYNTLQKNNINNLVYSGLFYHSRRINSPTSYNGIVTSLTNPIIDISNEDQRDTQLWGLFKVPTSGNYKFRMSLEDAIISLKINNQYSFDLIENKPSSVPPGSEYIEGSFIHLEAGKYYPIEIQIFQRGPNYTIQMRLESDKEYKDISSELYHIGTIQTEGFVFERNNQQQLLLFLLLILGGVYLYQKQQNQPIDIRIYIGIIVMYYILVRMR
jgi:hypothetical protein